jgi:hypothetical protein
LVGARVCSRSQRERERKEGARGKIGMRERERGPPGRLLVQEGGEQEVAGAGTATQVPAWAPGRRQRPHLSNTPPGVAYFSRKLQNRDKTNCILLFGNLLKI